VFTTDDIAADLPAPRDDEPESLRRDIVDELADHLQCALHRELHVPAPCAASGGREAAESDPATAARRRVLFRFGNPAALARRLWWEAMKERVMTQRITVAALVLLAAMSVGMFVLMWEGLATSRDLAAEAQAANRELLAEMRALLAARPSEPPANAEPAEWNNLKVKVVWDTEDGPPAEGVSVLLTPASENTKGIPSTEEVSRSDGVIDFGLVLYGSYELRVLTPYSERHTRPIAVRPGQDKHEVVVCPSEAQPDADVRVRVVWPEGAGIPEDALGTLWCRCTFRALGRRVADRPWFQLNPDGSLDGEVTLLVNGSGAALAVDRTWQVATIRGRTPGTTSRLAAPQDIGLAATRRLAAGDWRLDELHVGTESDKDGRRMFDVHTVRELRSQRDAWEGPSVFSTLPNAGTDAWDIRPTETIVRQSLLLQLDTESQSADLGAAARRSFSLLDVDQDEMISAQEWRASRRIRLAFERAGIDVSGSMSAEEFVRHFVATMGRPESNE
jgi:hypothetical protein